MRANQVGRLKMFYPEQIETLPRWVSQDLENSQVIGRSKQVIQTSTGKKYHLNNPLNELSGGEWTFFLSSVLSALPDEWARVIRSSHQENSPVTKASSIDEVNHRVFHKEG